MNIPEASVLVKSYLIPHLALEFGWRDDLTEDRYIYQFGLQYKPIPNTVIKADYRNFNAPKDDLPDDVNLGFGFIF